MKFTKLRQEACGRRPCGSPENREQVDAVPAHPKDISQDDCGHGTVCAIAGHDVRPPVENFLFVLYPLKRLRKEADSGRPLEAGLVVEDIQRSGLENLHVKACAPFAASTIGPVVAEREISRPGVGADIRVDGATVEFYMQRFNLPCDAVQGNRSCGNRRLPEIGDIAERNESRW